jgi:hypothetical protein
VQPCIAGLPHLAHAAGPDGREQFVRPETYAAMRVVTKYLVFYAKRSDIAR